MASKTFIEMMGSNSCKKAAVEDPATPLPIIATRCSMPSHWARIVLPCPKLFTSERALSFPERHRVWRARGRMSGEMTQGERYDEEERSHMDEEGET